MKRGLLVRFNEPLSSGEDPTVDLVVALNRVEAPGLWIPNLDRNRWDPSHPERHVELFTSGWPQLRQTRQHVVRVAKAHAKQFSEPAVCSFNIAALAWECIELAEPLDRALQQFFDYAATSLAQHLTADPAGVSAPIKVDERNRAVQRFRTVADALDLAIEAGDDDAKVYEILAATGVFWKLVGPAESPHRDEDGALCMWYPATRWSAEWACQLVTATVVNDVVPAAIKPSRAVAAAGRRGDR